MGENIMILFAWPFLFFLLPLPWLIFRFFPISQKRHHVQLIIPDLKDFDGFRTPASSSSFFSLKTLSLFLIWSLLIASAARPQWVGKAVEIPQSGRDLMLAVDLSGSMQMEDFKINGRVVDRLTALKWIAGDFIEKREGDRIGLILFGTNAYLQTPLTFDLKTVKQLLHESAVGLAGNETDIGDAIGLAVKQMRESPSASKVLILLTDGNNNTGELTPKKAAEIAAHAQLKVHTVAIGSNEMMIQTFFGPQKINPSAEIDEKTLQEVAEKTGGQYFRAYNAAELVNIYDHINRLEVIERDFKTYRPIDELYFWPLLIALFIAACWGCITIILRKLT